MLRLADLELPAWLNAELATLVAELPVSCVLSLARAEPTIGRGFRLKAASAPVLRQRLQTLLDSNADCTPAILKELRDNDLAGQLLRVLSEEAIQRQYKWLLGYYGAARLLLATLLDRRLKVRQLAEPWIANPSKRESLPEREECRRTLAANLAPFLGRIDCLTNASPTPKSVQTNTRAADTAQLRSLEMQLRKQSRLQEKLREQLANAQAAIDAEKHANSTIRARLREMRDAHDRARAELELLENAFSDRLAQALDAATGKLARYWLQVPTSAQRSLNETDAGLVDRIDQALARQAERDRHYGNRQKIAMEIDSLRTALQRLDDAMLSALNPDRELLPLREQAQTRLSQLRAQIDARPPPTNDTLARLEMAMQTARSPESLEQLSNLLEQLQQVDALDSTEVARIRNAHTSRMEVIFEQANPENQALLPADIRARREIAASSHAQVLIDGHNCLLAVDAIRRRFSTQQQAAGESGRRWLAQACGAIFESVANARVTLHFDGDERHQESVTGNLIVVFSGGKGEQRADTEIINQLHYLAADDTIHQPFLISNDHALRQQASALNAKIIDAEVLADWCNLFL